MAVRGQAGRRASRDSGGERGRLVVRDDLQPGGEDLGRAGDDVPGLEIVGVAVEVAHQSPRLADHQGAGRHVPGSETELPEAVVSAAAHVAQIQGGRARAAQAGGLLGQLLEYREIGLHMVEHAVGEARADEGILQLGPLGDTDAAVVEEGAAALGGGEELVTVGVEYHGLLHHATAGQGDGDGYDLFWNWRHTRSDSGWPKFGKPKIDAGLCVRALLGLLDPEEPRSRA